MALRTLFTWIHLSDVQLDRGDAGHAADQRMVLAALRDDIRDVRGGPGLRADAGRLVRTLGEGDERHDEALAADRGHLVRRSVSVAAS